MVGVAAGVSALVAIALAVTVFVVLPRIHPAAPLRPSPSPASQAPVSVPASSTSEASDTAVAESVVTSFYAGINAGDYRAVAALVTSATTSSVAPSRFKKWTATTFQIARSLLETDTAFVYGHESRRAFGSKGMGLRFTLVRIRGTWLIKTWAAVNEGAINGAMPPSGAAAADRELTDATARDIATSLLEARQVGDPETIRLLTTAEFQRVNAMAWLNGVDNTSSFTSFSIASVKKAGDAYVVTVSERWTSGAESDTYTVIDAGESLLVDAWTSTR